MRKWWLVVIVSLLAGICAALSAVAQSNGPGRLHKIYFNPYTDSIKTALNFYVNVEVQYENNRILPLDTGTIEITCDKGRMLGNEWIAPETVDFEKVTFVAIATHNPHLRDIITIYLKKEKDQRDEIDIPVVPKRRR